MKKILTILMIFIMCFSFVSADDHTGEEITTTSLVEDSNEAEESTESEVNDAEESTAEAENDAEESDVKSSEQEEDLIAELEEDEDEMAAKEKLAEVRNQIIERCEEARDQVELSDDQMNALEEAENRMQYIRDQHSELKADIAACLEENDKETCREEFSERVGEFKKLTKSQRVEVKCKALSSRVAAHLKNAWYGFDEDQKERMLKTADAVLSGELKASELKEQLKEELRKTKEERKERREAKVEKYSERLDKLAEKYPNSKRLAELKERLSEAKLDHEKLDDFKAATKARAIKKVEKAREVVKERMAERQEKADNYERKLLDEAEKHQDRLMKQAEKKVREMDGKKVDDLMNMPGAERFMENLDPESKKALEMARNEEIDTKEIAEALE